MNILHVMFLHHLELITQLVGWIQNFLDLYWYCWNPLKNLWFSCQCLRNFHPFEALNNRRKLAQPLHPVLSVSTKSNNFTDYFFQINQIQYLYSIFSNVNFKYAKYSIFSTCNVNALPGTAGLCQLLHLPLGKQVW